MNCVEEVLARIEAIEPLPRVLAHLLPRLQGDAFDFDEVEEIVATDPGLTGQVLRIANSCLYARPFPAASIGEGLRRLGRESILSAVMTPFASKMSSGALEGYALPAGALWFHEVATALAAEELASHLGWKKDGSVVPAALLLDIGKVVMDSLVASEDMVEDAAPSRRAFDLEERRRFGIDHAEAGALILKRWGLPPSIVEVVRHHHDPARCPEEFRPMARIVHLADHLCMGAGWGLGGDGLAYQIDPGALELIEGREGIEEEVIYATALRIDELAEAYGLELEVGP